MYKLLIGAILVFSSGYSHGVGGFLSAPFKALFSGMKPHGYSDRFCDFSVSVSGFHNCTHRTLSTICKSSTESSNLIAEELADISCRSRGKNFIYTFISQCKASFKEDQTELFKKGWTQEQLNFIGMLATREKKASQRILYTTYLRKNNIPKPSSPEEAEYLVNEIRAHYGLRLVHFAKKERWLGYTKAFPKDCWNLFKSYNEYNTEAGTECISCQTMQAGEHPFSEIGQSDIEKRRLERLRTEPEKATIVDKLTPAFRFPIKERGGCYRNRLQSSWFRYEFRMSEDSECTPERNGTCCGLFVNEEYNFNEFKVLTSTESMSLNQCHRLKRSYSAICSTMIQSYKESRRSR